jgi:hypothetical protein
MFSEIVDSTMCGEDPDYQNMVTGVVFAVDGCSDSKDENNGGRESQL